MPPKSERSFSHEDAPVQIVRVDNTALEAINRAEVDVQIATAKEYPRDTGLAMSEARSLILANEAVAGEMFYSLPRGGKTLQGPSTRFAECLAVAWGNCRVQVAIIGEDKRFVTAQAMAIDLQKNYGASVTVRRRITKSGGGTYDDDMIGVTSNAAISIAYRNSVLRMIPKPYWWDIYQQVLVMDDQSPESLEARVRSMLAWYEGQGAAPEAIFGFLGVGTAAEIGVAHLRLLRGAANAINQGEWSIRAMFSQRAGKAAPEAVEDFDDSNPDQGGSDATDEPQDDHRDALKNVRENLDALRGKR